MKCAVETLTQEWPWKLRGTQYVSILKVNKVGVSMSFHKAVYESTSRGMVISGTSPGKV